MNDTDFYLKRISEQLEKTAEREKLIIELLQLTLEFQLQQSHIDYHKHNDFNERLRRTLGSNLTTELQRNS